jgi:hypothetical protein
MTRSTIRRNLVVAAATSAAVVGLTLGGLSVGTAAAAQPAAAAPSAATAMSMPADSMVDNAPHSSDTAATSYFVGTLKGTNEVPVKGGPKVGDKDGSGTAQMRIQGNQVYFAFTWKGIGTPTMGHIHEGVKGKNGAVVIPFFLKKLPAGHNSVSGTVKVTDTALLARIKNHPEQFYFNLHTDEFPGGAVRGQVQWRR